MRMAPGRSPEELAALDMDDGEWERKGAALFAAQAERDHQVEMEKAAGLHDINSIRYDPEIRADARRLHNQTPSGPSPEAIIERAIIPIREAYLAKFETKAPAAPRKVGANEEAFNRLIGGNNG